MNPAVRCWSGSCGWPPAAVSRPATLILGRRSGLPWWRAVCGSVSAGGGWSPCRATRWWYRPASRTISLTSVRSRPGRRLRPHPRWACGTCWRPRPRLPLTSRRLAGCCPGSPTWCCSCGTSRPRSPRLSCPGWCARGSGCCRRWPNDTGQTSGTVACAGPVPRRAEAGASGAGSAVIEVSGLVKRYRGATANALDGVSFEVAEGAFFCLLGPNGAGKTTTTSILTTTLAPTSGRAAIAGLDVVADQARVRREVGVVFQQPSLDANLTAEENIRLYAVLYGCYPWRPSWRLMPGAYRRQVTELAEVLDLSAWLRRPVR